MQVVAEMAKNDEKVREEVEKKGLKLSITEKRKEGKKTMIASCGFLEEELQKLQQGRRCDDGRQC